MLSHRNLPLHLICSGLWDRRTIALGPCCQSILANVELGWRHIQVILIHSYRLFQWVLPRRLRGLRSLSLKLWCCWRPPHTCWPIILTLSMNIFDGPPRRISTSPLFQRRFLISWIDHSYFLILSPLWFPWKYIATFQIIEWPSWIIQKQIQCLLWIFK